MWKDFDGLCRLVGPGRHSASIAALFLPNNIMV